MYERMLNKKVTPAIKEMTEFYGENAESFSLLNKWLTSAFYTEQKVIFAYGNKTEFVGGIIMSSTGNLILAIIWIIASPLSFWAENTVMGIIWLCGGVFELIVALVRRNKEKKNE